VLLARDAAGLSRTSAEVKAVAPTCRVIERCVDFSDLPAIAGVWKDAIAAATTTGIAAASGAAGAPFTRALLLHNSGSLGGIGVARRAATATAAPSGAGGGAALEELDELRRAVDRRVGRGGGWGVGGGVTCGAGRTPGSGEG
jgi:hypothetical protein